MFTETVKPAGVAPLDGDTLSQLPEVTAALTLVALDEVTVSVCALGWVLLPGVKLKVSDVGEALKVMDGPDAPMVNVTGILVAVTPLDP